MFSDIAIYEIHRFISKNQEQSHTKEFWAAAILHSTILASYQPEQLIEFVHRKKECEDANKCGYIEATFDINTIFQNKNAIQNNDSKYYHNEEFKHYVFEVVNNSRTIKKPNKDLLFKDIDRLVASFAPNLTSHEKYERLKCSNGCASNIAVKSWAHDDDDKLGKLLSKYSWGELKKRAEFLEVC